MKRLLLGFGLCMLPLISFAYDSFECVGTEPFWNLSLTEAKFTFKQPNKPAISMSSVKPQPAESVEPDHVRVYRTKANAKNYIIVIQKQSCTNGMTDFEYAYEALFIDDKVYHGCCTKKLLLTQ